MRIAVVRHGQAVPKKAWAGEDLDRPLTERGLDQARDLVEWLDADPARLISSPALRCRQTMEPLSHHWDCDLEVSSSLACDAGRAAIAQIRDLVAATSGHINIVLCTHREVIVETLPLLAKDVGVKVRHRVPGAKGGVWLLDYQAERLESIQYRAPRV